MGHLNYGNIVAVIPDRTADRPPSRTALPYLEPDSMFVTIDGMQVHFTRSGDGPSIVFLHGSGSSLHSFNEVATRLEDHLDVVRLDLPGFGLTGPRLDRDYRIETYVSLLDRFLAEHVRAPFLLAGHSLGGQIAWRYCLDHPDRLLGLVLMNATGYPEKALPAAFRLARNPLLRPILRRWGSRAATARSLAAVVGPGSDVVDDEMVERVHTLMSRPGNRRAFVDLANTEQADRSGDIARIKIPTLVLRSDLVDGQHFARDIAGSREVVLTAVGHLMPTEAPEAVADAILEFASDIRVLAT